MNNTAKKIVVAVYDGIIEMLPGWVTEEVALYNVGNAWRPIAPMRVLSEDEKKLVHATAKYTGFSLFGVWINPHVVADTFKEF